ncbi:putative membrane protein [Holospora obtusa F1]|uniref:Membrane protein n=1 Tax=Holospora obtusa F1 TaxID=1399147 RepID=W6TDX3_HOLOB|nr:DUF2157 domain-containing protein [Holospora obtusa]ETZ07011.1 putative membrane protein [Holospora obtusa F1]
MNTKKNNYFSLEKISVNTKMVDELLSQGIITSDAHNYAIRAINSAQNWRLWLSRLFLVLGVSFVLLGILYFFSFNWKKIPPAMKLGSIQLLILGCLGSSYFYGLTRISGKIMLFSASILVGIFLAVFGQIYQTGADEYTLFMMWGLLIVPWVILSDFFALWLVFLVITNVFLVLYVNQVAQSEHTTQMVLPYLSIVNLIFLGLREFFVNQGKEWLKNRWTREILVVFILVCLLPSPIDLILQKKLSTDAIVFGSELSLIVHNVLYFVYRYKIRDIRMLIAVILSGSVILGSAIYKALMWLFQCEISAFFFMIIIAIPIFRIIVKNLRIIAKEMEGKDV